MHIYDSHKWLKYDLLCLKRIGGGLILHAVQL